MLINDVRRGPISIALTIPFMPLGKNYRRCLLKQKQRELSSGNCLARDVASQWQWDFGSLYDYLRWSRRNMGWEIGPMISLETSFAKQNGWCGVHHRAPLPCRSLITFRLQIWMTSPSSSLYISANAVH